MEEPKRKHCGREVKEGDRVLVPAIVLGVREGAGWIDIKLDSGQTLTVMDDEIVTIGPPPNPGGPGGGGG